MKLVLIPPGEFQMGSPKELIEEELKRSDNDKWYKERLLGEGPQHRVRITRPFYLGVYLVTQEEYRQVMGANPSEFSATGERKDQVAGQDTKRFPVECVTWDNAVEFCQRLSRLPEERTAGRTYLLPTEAQWEHACRAGSTGRFSFSSGGNAVPRESDESEFSHYGWFNGNSNGTVHAVGLKRANAWGLYDMHGNVWEWCQDWYDKDYYTNTPMDDPAGPPGGSLSVSRGGTWIAPARDCRSAHRGDHAPWGRYRYVGFRVSQVLADTAVERAKMSPTSDAVQPSADTTATIPSPASPASNPQSPIPLSATGSLIGADGKWKLPPGAPPPAVAPFDPPKATEHQEGWAKHLGVPVEITNSIGMKLVLIPPGEFMMGSPKELIEGELKRTHEELNRIKFDEIYKDHLLDEEPQHRVRITRSFYLGTYLVTQEEYQRGMGTNPSEFSATGKHKDGRVAGQDTKRFPVDNVSWDDAIEFCRKLSELPEERAAGRSYRLPTEAQWEYACRAGSTGRYGFSLNRPDPHPNPLPEGEGMLSDYGWFSGNSCGVPHAVGGKKPNAWALYDMHGNVWQWCQDWYDRDYDAASPMDDPSGPPKGYLRVYRGGCWICSAELCRSAFRNAVGPRTRSYDLGFRVSLVLPDAMAERAKMSRITDAVQPSPDANANKSPAAVATADSQSSVRPTAVSPFIGPDGKWKLPPGAPPPAVAPFDPPKAKEHQEGWAKHLGVPVETTNSIGMKLALIPPGEFQMGSRKELIEEELKSPGIVEELKRLGGVEEWYKERLPWEGPQHRVRITRPFCLGTYLVTQRDYQRVMGTNPSGFSVTGKQRDKVGGQDTTRFPVETVSWDDAVELAHVPPTIGGAVGVCVPRREHGSVQFQLRRQSDSQGRRRERTFRLRLVPQQRGRDDTCSWREAAQRVGIV
jgi:formylglycine-generating enzyme required for sulfatase activity